MLFTAEGELVEKLDNVAGVPTGIQAIGLSSQGLLAVKTARGVYLTDENLLEWVRADGPEINWSSTHATEPALLKSLQKAYRGTGLPMERIMLDLHSGRILGRAGVYIMDAAAIGFLLLAASGVWLWLRRRASIKTHRRKTESRRPQESDSCLIVNRPNQASGNSVEYRKVSPHLPPTLSTSILTVSLCKEGVLVKE